MASDQCYRLSRRRSTLPVEGMLEKVRRSTDREDNADFRVQDFVAWPCEAINNYRTPPSIVRTAFSPSLHPILRNTNFWIVDTIAMKIIRIN